MPIYDYDCRACGHRFEVLVRTGTRVACPECGAGDLERLLSLPRVHSETTRQKSLRAARKRDQALGKDRMHEQRKYELDHDD